MMMEVLNKGTATSCIPPASGDAREIRFAKTTPGRGFRRCLRMEIVA